MVTIQKGKCKCQTLGTDWTEEPPTSLHRYRVSCTFCGSYLKWGNQEEYDRLLKSGVPVRLFRYQPPATLEGFFNEEP